MKSAKFFTKKLKQTSKLMLLMKPLNWNIIMRAKLELNKSNKDWLQFVQNKKYFN